ncbi:MAG TPA: hypothetical protein VIH35_06915, partial [Kiritimatiellia bacterium]
EFAALGWFDTNALPDLVVVDKVTGQYRAGLQQAGGDYAWNDARGSGVTNVTGFSLGRLFTNSLDGLAFTAPAFNRVNALPVDGQPVAYNIPTIGPNLVVVYELDDTGNNTNRDDLFVATRLNSPPDTNGYTLYRLTPTQTTQWDNASAGAPLVRGNKVRLGTVEYPAMIAAGPNRLDILATISSLMFPTAQATNLPTGCVWTYGTFTGTADRVFLFYVPGTSNLQTRLLNGADPGPYTFLDGTNFQFAAAISQVIVLETGGVARLLIIFNDGASAAVYSFDGLNAPALVQTINPVAGDRFTLAAGLPGGEFVMLRGPTGKRTSESVQRYANAGTTNGPSGSLPALKPFGDTANVLVFAGEPLANPDAILVDSRAAGDWSSSPSNLPGTIQVMAETFGSTTGGLGGAQSVALGESPTNATHALANQVGNEFSVFSYSLARGASSPDVNLAPPSGVVDDSVTVTLTASDPSASLYYRDDGGAWQSYASPLVYTGLAPGAVVSVDAYASLASGPKSPIRTATYSFNTNDLTPPVAGGDSEEDLLYDPWQDYFGVEDGNDDEDGDGYSNREEMFAGTDPQDSESHPASPPADVMEPLLTISRGGTNSQLLVRWHWPTQYVDEVQFTIQSALQVTNAFSPRSLSIFASGGTNTATLSATNAVEIIRLRPALP